MEKNHPVVAVRFISHVRGGQPERMVLFGPASEHLRAIDGRLVDAQGWGLVALLTSMTVFPAICEELLFRGYLLGALRNCMPIALAIGVVTLSLRGGSQRSATHLCRPAPGVVDDPDRLALRLHTRTAMWVHFTGNLIGASLGAAGLANADHMPPWLHALALGVAMPCFLALLPWVFPGLARQAKG